ncbi:hypothetical protein AMS68_006873 [Peltaster fructicola]|uniref:Zn(2)-C6 fungal-type domain-containing protein n=1 Tax=Peltaster fructicola TaxID=286661 RepID=A0A6H0Y325_9PEZI|nr:hypothetical protein AMS68_006873 [Peltaster fructicola]
MSDSLRSPRECDGSRKRKRQGAGDVILVTTPSSTTTTNLGVSKPRKRRAQLSCNECKRRRLSCDRSWPCQRCVKDSRDCRYTSKYTAEEANTLIDQLARHPASRSILRGLQVRLEDGDSVPMAPSPDVSRNDTHREQSARFSHVDAMSGEPRLSPSQGQAAGHSTRSRMFVNHNVDATSSRPISAVQETTAFLPQSEQEISLPSGRTGTQLDRRGLLTPMEDLAASSHLTDKPPRTSRCKWMLYRTHSLFRFFVEVPILYDHVQGLIQQLELHNVNVSKKATLATSEVNVPSESDTENLVAVFRDQFDSLYNILSPTFDRDYQTYSQAEHAPSFKVLLLAISSAAMSVTDVEHLRHMPLHWLTTCQEWLAAQTAKKRSLLYYQIACITHLAKRTHLLGKKQYWQDTGALLQTAMMDGLHLSEDEEQRRLWLVICELNLQTSLEFGLPSLLHSMNNIPDELSLRLVVSKRLYDDRGLTFADTMHYTRQLIDLIAQRGQSNQSPREALQQCQYRDCIIAMHRRYLDDWMSQNLCYQMAYDNLRSFADHGKCLPFVREDLLLSSMILLQVTLLPSHGFSRAHPSTSTTVLRDCLPLVEFRYLHTCVAEPWCVITMLAIISIMEAEMDNKPKALQSDAERFLTLRDKRLSTSVLQSSHTFSDDLDWNGLWEDEWTTDWLTMSSS